MDKEERMIGRYKIVREIGRGGMGIVYKGLDPQSQRPVAIKVLPAANVDRTTVERFNREAQAMAKVKHPDLIEIYDHGMTGGEHYLVMEFVDGDTLKNFLKHRGKISVTECLEIATQIVDALICIHGEGMIHRDIKPGNIMITTGARIKLMDLGLVHIPGVTRVTVEGSAVGTAEYMSPEQSSDEGVDTRSDIYSLGVTIYEMLAGQPPFQGETIHAILMKQRNEPPPPLKNFRPDVPQELERIIAKAMAKDIKDRYQRIQEMREDIQKLKGQSGRLTDASPSPAGQTVAGSKTIPVTPALSLKKVAAPKLSRRKGVPLLSVVLIGAVLLGGGYAYRGQLLPWAEEFWERAQNWAPGKKKLADATEEILAKLEQAEDHYERGQDFERKGDLEQAIAEYEQAVQFRSDYGLYYHDLAVLYEKNSQKELAVVTWQNLLRNASGSSYADIARARIVELTK